MTSSVPSSSGRSCRHDPLPLCGTVGVRPSYFGIDRETFCECGTTWNDHLYLGFGAPPWDGVSPPRSVPWSDGSFMKSFGRHPSLDRYSRDPDTWTSSEWDESDFLDFLALRRIAIVMES